MKCIKLRFRNDRNTRNMATILMFASAVTNVDYPHLFRHLHPQSRPHFLLSPLILIIYRRQVRIEIMKNGDSFVKEYGTSGMGKKIAYRVKMKIPDNSSSINAFLP